VYKEGEIRKVGIYWFWKAKETSLIFWR
jgi:hypothetical protein